MEVKIIKVLSLFDGISCGRVALERAGIPVEKYYASEIDKYAIQVAQKNYPDTIQVGDVTQIDGSKFRDIDILIGGSPCQGFSFAGKQLNFEDPRSRLFFEYVRILNKAKPKYFLLENVKMKKEHQDVISTCLGVEPIKINSTLVSAQNRERLYWTNISNIVQPEDKKIFLSDILESGYVDSVKSYCIDASYFKGGNLKSYFEKHRRQIVFEVPVKYNRKDLIKSEIEKALTLLSSDWLRLNRNQDQNCVLYTTDGGITFYIRKLTPIECERLQTLPDNYTDGISNTQRYKCIGNGWTVDVISHIFGFLNT